MKKKGEAQSLDPRLDGLKTEKNQRDISLTLKKETMKKKSHNCIFFLIIMLY